MEKHDIKNPVEYMNSIDTDTLSNLIIALHNLTLQNGGFTWLARETGLCRESLYKALDARTGNPHIKTILKIIKANGLSLCFNNSDNRLLSDVWKENFFPKQYNWLGDESIPTITYQESLQS